MKAFLMFPDHNFNLMETMNQNEENLIKDLELMPILNAMSQNDQFIFGICKQAILNSLHSMENIQFRQEIVKDCLKYPNIIKEIYQLSIESSQNKENGWLGIYSHHPREILLDSLKLLNMFMGLMKKLRLIADKNIGLFSSNGFKRFFSLIQEELTDDYFSNTEKLLDELQFRDGITLSAELGKGNEPVNYVLRKKDGSDQTWKERIFRSKNDSYSFTLEFKDTYGIQVLKELQDIGTNIVASVIAQSVDHIDNFLGLLQIELAFYIGCLNLYDQIIQYNEYISFPVPKPINERLHSFSGLYDITLALVLKKQVVANDFNLQSKSLVLISGANQGGKSTFLRSIGIAQVMMQAGMFVPAQSFSANISANIFTHFRREEDELMQSGKLDEELERMSFIIDNIRTHSLVLFNESFASTNEREGSEIAFQIINALLDNDIKIFFVTHLYYLAQKYYDYSSENVVFLRATRNHDGKRSFKLIEAKPLETSFGKDIFLEIFNKSNIIDEEN